MKDDDIGTVSTDERLFTLIYNSESRVGKQAYGYVQGIAGKVHTIDISKTKVADTMWVSLAEKLKVPLKDLLATEHPDAPDMEGSDFDTDDWLKVLQKNPVLLQTPIAFRGQHIILVNTPSDVLQLLQEGHSAKQ